MPAAIIVLLCALCVGVVAAAVVPLAHAIVTDEGNDARRGRGRGGARPGRVRGRDRQHAGGLTAAQPMA